MVDDEQNEDLTSPTEEPSPAYAVFGWIFLVVAIGGACFLAYRLYPAHHAASRNPSFIDNVFDSNLVLFAARLVLVAAALVLAVTAVFVVLSFYQRGKAGHWLTRFGPLETQAIEDLRGEVERWQNLWLEATQEGDELRERLEQSDELIEQLYQQLAEAEQQPPRSSE